jgi:hypothetical protein
MILLSCRRLSACQLLHSGDHERQDHDLGSEQRAATGKAAGIMPVSVAPAGSSALTVTEPAAWRSHLGRLYSDNVLPVNYQGSVAVATPLPTATTMGNVNFATVLVKQHQRLEHSNRNTIEPAVKITLTLQNNTAASRNFVLLRCADIDANNAHGGDFQNWFDNDDQSVAHTITGSTFLA